MRLAGVGGCFVLALVLAACTGDAPEAAAPSAQTNPGAGEWRSNPAAGVRLGQGPPVQVQTGPHTLLIPGNAPALAPPYTVRATLHKQGGRLHEGYGLVFGGANLDSAEARQSYSYFMVRGDGSFLIKQRQGAATAVIRDWTNHPAVPRDTGDGGSPLELTVHVAAERVRFEVAGQEVALVPAADLRTTGRVAVRVAHGVKLSVDAFGVSRGS